MDGVDLNTLTVLASIASLTTLLLTATVVRQYHIRKALRLSEEKFSKAVGFSPDAVTISHLSDGCFIEVNDSFSTLTGYSRSEALGRTSIELRLWDDPGGRQALLESLKQSGTVRNQEIAFRHKDGHAIHTLLSTAVFNLDNRPCLLTVARDVTDWKLAQARLQRLAERDRLTTETAMRIRQYSDLEDILKATVIEVRHVLKVDRAFVHQIHRDISTIVAESRSASASSLLGQEDQIPTQAIRQRMEQASVVQVDDVDEIEGNCPYRSFVQRHDIQAAMGAAIMVDGALFGVLVVHQCHRPRQWQAYERKLLEQVSTQMAIAIQQATLLQQVNDLNVNLEQQVAERTAQLKQQMAEVQERNRLLRFSLHAVSHDLRTSAVGSLMVLQSLTSSGEAAISVPREVLQRMQQGAEQQLHKLESLQDIYTAKTVGLVLNRSAVTLASLAKRSAQELASLFEESQAELMLELPEDLPTLWVDPDTICQVFRQLLTNAITHNAPGIKITISARQTGDRLCCRIEDTGKGLSPAHCARLFELCTDALDVRHYGRICLGLYRCRQIIEAHQGTIAAVTPSVGVAIEFTLPYLQASK